LLAIDKYMRVVRKDAPWCPSNIEFIRRINGLGSTDDVKRIVFDASYLVLGLGDVYYYNTKQYAEAAENYKRGLELRPGNATAEYNLGWCYNDLERYDDAIDALRKATASQPNYPEAHNEFGYALHQLGRFQEAVQQYQIAIQQKTDYASAHYNLGMSFLALRNRQAALQQYRILQRIDNARATKLFNQIK
jgi:tetratricopeptide (TPR) repeat protein